MNYKGILSSFGILALIIVSCGQTIPPSAQKTVEPTKRYQIKVGKEPSCVEAADLNKDKIIDLVVANQADSTITILLGNGKGQFKEVPGSPFASGYLPNDVALGDINNDGTIDLVVANHERKYFTLLIGDGKGGFKTQSSFATTGIPHVHGIALGHFNKDKQPDVVTDSWGNDQLEIHFGDEVNFFKKEGLFVKVGKRPYQRHRVGDVNGDELDDIVATNNESNTASILLADGKGGFNEASGSPFPCGDNPFGVAIGDLNADGKADLAIIDSPGSMAEGKGKNGMTILIGDGTGKFVTLKGSPFEAGNIPSRVAVGDVNGDGVNDVVTSDNDSNKIYLFMLNKNGGVKTSMIEVGSHPKGIAIADLDGDKKGDIVVCNNSDNDISILISK